ncbi:phage tail protein [Lysinibacillus capsici]|uniref:phage tail protein n=1 Tax=Lysinibacillus capsici TaxID=2115968 RepID=UPI003BA9B02B
MNGNFTAQIGARITQFMARMRQVREAIRTSANDVRVDIGADISGFNRRMAEIRARIAALVRDKVVVKIEARIENLQRKIQRIATDIRAFGELMQHTLQGSIIAVLPMIAPLLANVGVAITNLGPMIGTLAGSTFALAGAFASAGVAAGAFAAVAIPTIKKLFDENAQLNAAQKNAKASFDNMKSTYQSLVKETEKPALNAFTSAMQVTNTLLTKLRPLFLSSAQAVSSLMTQLNTAIGTPPIQKFLDYLNTTGAPMLKTVTRSMGNLLQGVFSMLTAFAPLTASTAKGFEEMTARFAEWSNGLSGSSKFQSFMDYVNTNMPKIRAIFRDATAGLIYFFAAFGGSSSDMMTGLENMMARFKEWSASLSQNQGFQTFLSYVQQTAPSVLQLIGNLTNLLVNLGIGMAPVGAGLMNIVNSILEFINSGMESNRVIGVLLASFISIGGVLLAVVPNVIAFRELFKGLGPAIIGGIGKALPFITGLFTNFGGTMAMIGAKITSTAKLIGVAWGFITSPIGLVIIGITAVIAIFVKMYKTNEEFRGNVQKIWHSISKVISDVTTEIKNVVTKIWGFVTDFWIKNQKNILDGVKSAWSLIEIAINYSLKNIMSLFQIFWPIISGTVKIAWNLIKSTVQIGLNLVSGIIKTVTSLIQGDWQGAWSNIKQTAINIWNSIESFFRNINLFEIGKNIIQGLIKGINSMWENVKKTAAGIADLIPDWLKKKLGIHSP